MKFEIKKVHQLYEVLIDGRYFATENSKEEAEQVVEDEKKRLSTFKTKPDGKEKSK